MNANDTIAALLDPNQKAAVTEIIKLLSDRERFEQRLNAIKAVAETADKKMKDASAQAEKYATAEKMLADATAMLMKQSNLETREKAVAEREQAAAERERKLSAAASLVRTA